MTNNPSNGSRSNLVAGLDIGTTKIACFIGERAESGKYRIIGYAKTESVGVVHGVVKNIIDTANSIKIAVTEASEMAKVPISEVYVGIAGQHIKSGTNRGSIMIPENHDQIEPADIQRLIDDQYHIMLEPGEDIIHVFPQDYFVDNELLDADIDPVGVAGKCLMANFHIVTGNSNNIKYIRRAVEMAGLTICGVVLEPVASAYAVLNDLDRSAGVTLVDIGGGTTDIAIFKDHNIRHTSVIPLAGNSITNDIRDGCHILKHQAESLKTKFGSCVPAAVNQDDIISIPGIRNQPAREIGVKTLAGIIKARTQMILDMISFEIENSGYKDSLLAGITLTGGGSQLKNIREYCEFLTGIDTRIGIPNEHLEPQGGVSPDELSHPMYSTGIGLVIYGIIEREKAAEKAAEKTAEKAKHVEPEAQPEPETNDAAEEKDEPKAKRQKKAPRTDKNLNDIFKNWVTKIFEDDDLAE